METTEMIAFLKHLNDDFYGQGKHFVFTSQDADTIYEIALRMETMLEKNAQKKISLKGKEILDKLEV